MRCQKKVPVATSSTCNTVPDPTMFVISCWYLGLSSANYYVSMLTREQLSVLRSIRPSVLYEFLQEVAKVRSDKRMRRALPNVSNVLQAVK